MKSVDHIELGQPLDLTPQQIVDELNRFVVGQDAAKKAIAVAIRNRWRRVQQLKQSDDKKIMEEVTPYNILMIGPTGVGKTEIARRLAQLTSAPFIKVEATKFTEVGYVGKDVDSIIRDLLECAIQIVNKHMRKSVYDRAHQLTIERIIDALVGDKASNETREIFLRQLIAKELDDQEIEITISDVTSKKMDTIDMQSSQVFVFNDMLKAFGGQKTKTVFMKIKDAFEVILREESEKLIDEGSVIQLAIKLVEEDGIVFIDEIDKIANSRDTPNRTEISREGVQRDLLPLIEGTTVSTKYGTIKTDKILFIGSGAFLSAKPSDLLPELQGRLPIQVKLQPLKLVDMIKILTEPEYNNPKKFIALMKAEKVAVVFTDCGIETMAKVAVKINKTEQDTGARRLHSILEQVTRNLSFNAPNLKGETVTIDAEYVQSALEHEIKKSNTEEYLL